jgi:uncharacterized membrane protein
MAEAAAIALLWLVFGGTHMALSSLRLRPRLVAALSLRGFLGVYSLVALATFVPLVWLYFASRHAGPYLFHVSGLPSVRWLAYLAMGAALALLVAGIARPSPASMTPGRPEPAGVLRVTRHPVFMAFGLFGLAHLSVASVNLAELAFFAGFPAFALIGSWHQDARKLASGDAAFRRFHAATPFLPFSRPSSVIPALREDAVPIGVGVVAAGVIRWFHPQLFGG